MVGPTPRAAAPFAATSGPPGPGPHAAARPSPRVPRHRGREARPCGCCAEWSRRRRPRPDPKVRTSIHNWAATSSSMSGESVASRFASRLASGTRSQANAAAPGTSEHVREEVRQVRGGTAGKVGGAAAGFSDMIRAALDKIDALQKCAENPTNPVLAGSCTNDAVALLISPRRVSSWPGPFAGRLGPCRTAAGSVRAPGQAEVARWSPRSPAAARSLTGGLGVLGGSATGGEYGELGEEVVVDPGEVEA